MASPGSRQQGLEYEVVFLGEELDLHVGPPGEKPREVSRRVHPRKTAAEHDDPGRRGRLGRPVLGQSSALLHFLHAHESRLPIAGTSA
jgi:hypothetical protein